MGNLFREERVRRVVSATAKLIETTLVAQYGLPEDEASRLEEELFIWFDRLTRRPGTPDSSQLLRNQLISMACKIGHVYWVGRPQDPQRTSETVKRSLALGPDIIALELEKQFEESQRMMDQ
jgi:hypothetical protein